MQKLLLFLNDWDSSASNKKVSLLNKDRPADEKTYASSNAKVSLLKRQNAQFAEDSVPGSLVTIREVFGILVFGIILN